MEQRQAFACDCEIGFTDNCVATIHRLRPVSFMAWLRGMPARSRFLTAVRLKSCGMRDGQPAALQAAANAFNSDLMGRPLRVKTYGLM
jgi:hypothetical protein